MAVPNFSSLAGLEVPEKFVVEVPEVIWWDGVQVTTISNLNEVAFELLWVELGFDNYKIFFDSEWYLYKYRVITLHTLYIINDVLL